jgi:hypothetical protein
METYELTFDLIDLGLHCLSKRAKLFYEAVKTETNELYIRFFQILENGLFDELSHQTLHRSDIAYNLKIAIDDEGKAEPLYFQH